MKLELFITILSWITFVISSLFLVLELIYAVKYEGSVDQKIHIAYGYRPKWNFKKYGLIVAISFAWLLAYYIGD